MNFILWKLAERIQNLRHIACHSMKWNRIGKRERRKIDYRRPRFAWFNDTPVIDYRQYESLNTQQSLSSYVSSRISRCLYVSTIDRSHSSTVEGRISTIKKKKQSNFRSINVERQKMQIERTCVVEKFRRENFIAENVIYDTAWVQLIGMPS